MKGLSAHVDTLYATLPREQRFAAAARDGFRCVETWAAPPVDEVDRVVAELDRLGLALASVNTHAGPAAADFGLLGDPASTGWWREEFVRTLDFARRAGAGAINVLVGGRRRDVTRPSQLRCVEANLEWALAQASMDGPVLLVEPLNGADRRSPLVRDVNDALAIISALGSPANVRLLFDAYHLFQEEDDLCAALGAAGDVIGHVQIADHPGRGAPGSGDIPFGPFLAELQMTGYAGWIGLEYVPAPDDRPDFAWIDDFPELAGES
ncbi:MAG: hydroxypyruvate isomerase [Actinomycetota bacterium]